MKYSALLLFCWATGRHQAQYSQVRSSLRYQEAFTWMEYMFSLSESCPMSDVINLDTDTKTNIWKQYQAEMEIIPTSAEPISYCQFVSLWAKAFPYVRINLQKRVTGKCWTCTHINSLKASANGDAGKLDAAKALMHMHRSDLYMPERLAYRRRIHEATHRNPNTTMSVIIDGANSR